MAAYTSNDMRLKYPIIAACLGETEAKIKPLGIIDTIIQLLKSLFSKDTKKPTSLLDRVTPQMIDNAVEIRKADKAKRRLS